MTKTSRRNRFRLKLLRALRPWHRRLGLASALFILLLVFTGVAINHSDDFGLDQTPVTQSWLLDYYGIPAPAHVAQFSALDKRNLPALYITDNLLWQGKQVVFEGPQTLISASYAANMLVAMDTNQLYLFDSAGHLQETQNSSTGLPTGLLALAVVDGRVWLKTDSGVYQAGEQLIDWQPTVPLKPLSWLMPNPQVNAEFIQHARSAHLNWQRVMLDLHSGRLFGALTVWLWDLFALALLLVSLSGFWIWYQKK
ncbi:MULTISPECIES: PepSY-associated TM helix domain-containing protein [Shewanella]|uniref:PepSY-associated TM helix domain-containing protein n=1 Tax=Shewanella TaxID=22 RepID=UPI000C6C12EB|nr:MULTISPECIES: PepSY-associated TM helix domain-containing protein [Shewanella]NCQ47129.1 PepSY domain-containing protein [Shewanella frigidimarina]NCO73205.1 PepSY domain-containing protein [Shewanella vesiculosa]NCP38086.1 PepSY domain-containing protein [Shewanella vesiculosa]NCP71474.1 PepSY domain-containing protein [Shewanella vesiculosa]NCP75733.1 PepSY domain-containing protein [Shewanella vesiculosa]